MNLTIYDQSAQVASGTIPNPISIITITSVIGDGYSVDNSIKPVTGLDDASTSIQSDDFAGALVLIFIGDIHVPKYDEGNGNTFYSKTLASDTIGLSSALSTGDSVTIYIFGTQAGGGGMPGIDDVIAVGQALTVDRSIDVNSHNLDINNANAVRVTTFNFTVHDKATLHQVFDVNSFGPLSSQVNNGGTWFTSLQTQSDGTFQQNINNGTNSITQIQSDPAAFHVYTFNAAQTSSIERLTILGQQDATQVGIGVPNPIGTLHLFTIGTTPSVIIQGDNGVGESGTLSFTDTNGDSILLIGASAGSDSQLQVQQGALVISTQNSNIGVASGQDITLTASNGDINANSSGGIYLTSTTAAIIINSGEEVTISSGDGQDISLTSSGNVGFSGVDMILTPSGNVVLANLPTYANEAAAILGGLQTDAVYKTLTGQLMIKL